MVTLPGVGGLSNTSVETDWRDVLVSDQGSVLGVRIYCLLE